MGAVIVKEFITINRSLVTVSAASALGRRDQLAPAVDIILHVADADDGRYRLQSGDKRHPH